MADEDSLFEKALARQLRQPGPENRGGVPGEPIEEFRTGCPDAEVLAAYHERILRGGETMACQEHVASCARCQEILALLETTEDVSVSADGAERDAVVREAAHAPWFVRGSRQTESRYEPVLEAAPRAILEVAGASARLSAANASAPSVTAKREKRAMAYWLAPLGAIAAGLLLWVGVQTNTKNISRPAAVETAQIRSAPSAVTVQPEEATKPTAPGSPTPHQATAAKSAARTSTALTQLRPALRARGSGGAEDTAAPAFEAQTRDKVPSPAHAVGAVSESAEISASPAPIETAPGTTAGANVVTNQETQQLEVDGRNVSQLKSRREQQNAQKSAASRPASPAVPTAADQAAVTAQAQAAVTGAAQVNEQAETAGTHAKKVAADYKRAMAASAGLIASPGGNVIWRVGQGGKIEQSRDAGATWSLQATGVTVDLQTGSAPSDAVCWVIGRGGTLLLTVDGGGHWSTMTSPISGEIGGVQAADALNATVWDAGKKHTFITNDGGVLWKRLPNK